MKQLVVRDSIEELLSCIDGDVDGVVHNRLAKLFGHNPPIFVEKL